MLGAVVVGAGQAGLAASYHLTQRGIEHVVLERGRVGETWLTQRWDTFALNTPGWRSHVREDDPDRRVTDDAFLSAPGFVGRLEAFAGRHDLRVRTGTTVRKVAPAGLKRDEYVVAVDGAAGRDEVRARSVIVASGIQNVPRTPPLAADLPPGIRQMTTADYRRAADLPTGAVLVVGGAQSGVQIAEDVLAGGRKVYLCTSSVGRMPRRHRGRDMFAWLGEAGFFDQTPDQLPDPGMRFWAQPQVSGVGHLGHTVSLQGLAAAGVTLLGRPTAVDGDRLLLDDTVGANLAFGDRVSRDLKALADRYLDASGAVPAPVEPDPADEPHPDPAAVHSPAELDLAAAGIASVIWATGFTGDFGYLPAAVLDDRRLPVHDRGVATLPGIFFLGFPWLTRRKSGIIPGVDEDAAMLADHVARRCLTDGG